MRPASACVCLFVRVPDANLCGLLFRVDRRPVTGDQNSFSGCFNVSKIGHHARHCRLLRHALESPTAKGLL